MQTKVIVALSYLVILLSGYRLSRIGKPYSSLILTVHKLVALAAGVWLAVVLYNAHRVAALGAPALVAALVSGLLFLGAAISGGLLGTGKTQPPFISTVHEITPLLALLATAITLYLMGGI